MKKSGLQTFLYVLTTVLTLLALFMAYRKSVAAWVYTLAVLFFFLSSVFLPTLHELGHLVCGKLCGMRFVSLSVSLWTVYKNGNKLRCKLNTARSERTAGACRMYPEKAENAEKKFLFFALGGVLFNALYLAAGLFFTLFFNNGILWLTLGMTLPYCVYLLVLNLIPSRGEDGDYDGAVIWGLLKKEPSAVTAANLLAAQGFTVKGSSPAEIPVELLFGLPQLPEDDPNFTLLKLWQYAYYLDGGEGEKAARCIIRLESCLDYIPENRILPVYCELAYAYSLLQPDREKAKKYYTKLTTYKIPADCAADACRAEVAYALMTGDRELAGWALRNLEASVEQVEESGMKKFRTRLTTELEKRVKESVSFGGNGIE